MAQTVHDTTFITQTLLSVMSKNDMSQQEITQFMELALQGAVNAEQLAAFLCCLKMKGETVDEILGLILAMRQNMQTFDGGEDAVDVCGTGGDRSGTFNISTTVGFVVAGAGARVAKHGNRAASSQAGSADVLEALGVTIQLSPEQAQAVLEKVGLVFLFAPAYHPAMKHVVPVRKALGVPTIFNKLGPFSNPARVRRQLVGIPDLRDAQLMASVAQRLPYDRLLIVCSDDGLDEVSIAAPTTILQVENGVITKSNISPSEVGLTTASMRSLKGGDARQNAMILRSILEGEVGPRRDVVVLNAGCALYAAGTVMTIAEGVAAAIRAIDSGRALHVLEQLIAETKQYA